ncbi:hypothetical protein [Rhodococcus sp. WAY2]|uniref:hypothetical protein n=1 Tax=Rhodococcus sp. WAY2 TaxID=2663121 RepID=UPI00135CE234|nr:hypothetical protein [Rhodococcus sp. WAY2]
MTTAKGDRTMHPGPGADSTNIEDICMAAVSVWIVVAVHLDGRAHWLELPDSFFTWWHALLYGGLGASIALLVMMGIRRRAPRESWVRAAAAPPRGYGWALIGALIFGAGGVGDMLWHSIFGIETGIDALLSPTHLLLFGGAALLFSGPVLAVRAKTPDAATWKAPPMLAAASIAAMAGFALSYLSAFTTDAPLRAVENFPEGTAEHAATETPAVAGLASYLITSLVLVAPLAYLLRCRRLPFGAITVFVTALALLAVMVQDFTDLPVVLAVLVAGLIIDIALAVAGRSMSAHLRTLGIAFTVPLAIWSAQLVELQLSEGIRWSPELAAGAVLVSAMVSTGVVLVLAYTGDAGNRTNASYRNGHRNRRNHTDPIHGSDAVRSSR